MDFTIYKKLADKTIDKAWIEIFKLTQKFCVTQSELKVLTTLKERLTILLRGLSNEYMNIQDHIDAQNKSDIETAIQKLQEKEAQLKAKGTKTEENDLWVKRGDKRIIKEHHKSRHLFSSNDKTKRLYKAQATLNGLKGGCYICDKEHIVIKCEFHDKLVALRTKIRVCIVSFANKHKNKRAFDIKKTYNVNDDSESDSFFDIVKDSKTDEDKKAKKIVALFKKVISKVLRFK